MKKIKYFLFVLTALCCVSCYDESGEFVEQMQTDEQITLGLRACLKTAVDTASSHLFVDDGFSMYDNAKHAITLPTAADIIRDTLAAHGEEVLIDSLLAKSNRAAEKLGSVMKTNFYATITGMTFSKPSEVLRGNDDAATVALQVNYDATLKSMLAQSIATQLTSYGVSKAWNQVLLAYAKYTATPVSIDYYQYVTDRIFAACYAEMKIEEANIRHLPKHRVSDILKTTFSVLD